MSGAGQCLQKGRLVLVIKIPGNMPTPFRVMEVSPCLKRLGKEGEKTVAVLLSPKVKTPQNELGGEV